MLWLELMFYEQGFNFATMESKRVQAMKGNNIELNESHKEEPYVLVHTVKGYIFVMKVSSTTT
jgi:hypothetical protein